MIATSLVAEIRRLLAEKRLSHRRIARYLGVNRRTVMSIALNRKRRPVVEPEVDSWQPEQPAARCLGCGAMVHGKCLSCHLPKKRAVKPASSLAEELLAQGPLGLDLKPVHRTRYEAIRQRIGCSPRADTVEPSEGTPTLHAQCPVPNTTEEIL